MRDSIMWVVTFKTVCGPVSTASRICKSRLEALRVVRKMKDFIAERIDDSEYISGKGSMHGVEYCWAIQMYNV